MKKILEKIYLVLFYTILAGLFLKGEIFKVHTCWFSFTFTSVKNITILYILYWIILRVINHKKPDISLSFWILLGAVSFSVIVSKYRAASLEAFYVFLIYTGWFYSMRDVLINKGKRINLCILMITIAIFVSITDISYHYSVGIGSIIERYPFWNGKNALGLFLVISFGICASFLLYSGSKKNIYLLTAGLIILLLGIVFTYSRSAWIACLVPVIGIILIKIKRGIWVVIGGVVILLILSPQFASKRFRSIFNIEDTNIKNRLYIWRDTAGIIKANPVIGTGIGTFRDAYKDYYPQNVPADRNAARIYRHPHCLYLQILAETGIIGFLIFIWLILSGLVKGIKKTIYEKDPYLKAVRYGSLLGIISFLVYSITDCTLSWQFIGDSFSHINLIWLLLWICCISEEKKFQGISC